MSNRIKELAVKAGANWNHGDFNMGSSVEFQEGDLEKFAELLIRECAELCAINDPEQAEILLKHFGVE